jgi:ABC-type antimicrobial peptide transport system permease subunit
MPVPQLRTLTEEVAEAVEVRTLRLALVGGLAVLAFVVAAGGLCGALVRDVVERRRELAIRGALGLTPRRVVATVLAGGAGRATFGAALGLMMAVAMGRAMAAVLYGVSPYDVLTYVMVFAVVVSVALVASYIPARRASRINPVELLRAE